MTNNMTRDEKIEYLERLAAGEATPEDLLPAQAYFFIERSTRPGVYECNGREYSQQQYELFRKNMRSTDRIYNEGRDYAINEEADNSN